MPLGILGTAVWCDIGARISGYALFGIIGYYNLTAGLVFGFVALLIVFVELVTLPSRAANRELLGTSCAAMTAMIGIFALVWSVRADGPRAGNGWLLAAELLALAAGGFAVWLGQGIVIGHRMREPVQMWLPTTTPNRRQ